VSATSQRRPSGFCQSNEPGRSRALRRSSSSRARLQRLSAERATDEPERVHQRPLLGQRRALEQPEQCRLGARIAELAEGTRRQALLARSPCEGGNQRGEQALVLARAREAQQQRQQGRARGGRRLGERAQRRRDQRVASARERPLESLGVLLALPGERREQRGQRAHRWRVAGLAEAAREHLALGLDVSHACTDA
jgi:hypothetical protein